MPYTRLDDDATGSPSHTTTPIDPTSNPSTAPSTTPLQLYAASVTSHERYDGRTSVILGAIQIAGGLLAVLNQIILYFLHSISTYVSAGIWCGIPYIIAGSFGVVAGKKKTYCLIVTYMVLAIIFLVVSTALVVTSASSLAHDHMFRREFETYEFVNGTHNHNLDPTYYHYLRGTYAVNSLQLIVYVCEFITLIWGSTLACKVTCCSPPQQQIPLVAQVKYENGQTILVLGSGALPQGESAGRELTQDGGAINTTLQSDEQKSRFV